jgi:hypothetical protein
MSREIPKHLQDMVSGMPEYSYGVNRVVVTLDDGTKFYDVFIAWAKEIVKVGTSEQTPFDPSRIIQIEKQ